MYHHYRQTSNRRSVEVSMKINTSIQHPDGQTTFTNVPVGAIFKRHNIHYMKCHICSEEKAVRLDTGNLHSFAPDTRVIPAKSINILYPQ